MLELRVMNDGQSLPLFDLPAAYGREKAARELGDTIEGLIAFLDDLGGDPDLEDSEGGGNMVDEHGRFLGDCPPEQDEDREPDNDARDVSWPEWHSRGRHKLSRFGSEEAGQVVLEDDEDDDPDTGIEDDPLGCDPETDMCLAGDDRVASGSCTGAMLICEDTGPGDADDAERDQQTFNVPCDVVVSLDHEPFRDRRRSLGRSDLLTSFQTNGSIVLSADSGREHRTTANDNPKPGEPV